MSATTPNPKQSLPKSKFVPPYNQVYHLAINTNTKRLHSSLDPYSCEYSSGLPPKKVIKSPQPVAFLISPPLKKGLSWMNSANSASTLPQKNRCVPSEKSSGGLWGPKSSSSHSNNNFDFKSPQGRESTHSQDLYEYKEWEEIKSAFNSEFYRRVDEFLDREGLNIIDLKDYIRGDIRNIRKFKSLRVLKQREGMLLEEGEQECMETVKSARHSPKLINESIISSNLFQRRASHSQAPIKAFAFCEDDSPLKTKFSRYETKLRSPIIEKDTPQSFKDKNQISLRGSLFNTPNSVKGFNFLSPDKQVKKAKAASKDNSPDLGSQLKELPLHRQAHSVHGKVSKGSFFKLQNEFSSLS